MKNQEEKIAFLKKAYEIAAEYNPKSPFSVNINPRELGKQMGYGESRIVEIVSELIKDGYATSTLGMHSFFVTKLGGLFLN